MKLLFLAVFMVMVLFVMMNVGFGCSLMMDISMTMSNSVMIMIVMKQTVTTVSTASIMNPIKEPANNEQTRRSNKEKHSNQVLIGFGVRAGPPTSA
jgi:hypothetical protein